MDKSISDYLQLLQEHCLFLGDFDIKKVGKPAEYFWTHQIWIDFRGDVKIHPDAFVGYGVKILTASHIFETGVCGKAILKHVWIDDSSFVGAFSLLYNCWLQHHAVVAAGAVVRNITVPPYCIVEGNPAKIVKQFKEGRWQRVE
jgi:acetyltransferase-like isoleucine patch superfamily enzyme